MPQQIFDGENIWVLNAGSNNVSKLRGSDGAPLGTVAVASSARSLAFDGANIWVPGSNVVTRLQAWTALAAGETLNIPGNHGGIAFDGTSLWVTNADTQTVSKFPARPR